MHRQFLPSATSHYIRCVEIDQYFGSHKADQIALTPPTKLSRSSFRGREPAWGAALTRERKGIPKRARSEREVLPVIAKRHEAPTQRPARNRNDHREAIRNGIERIQARLSSLHKITASRIATAASRRPRNDREKLRGIRKRFATDPESPAIGFRDAYGVPEADAKEGRQWIFERFVSLRADSEESRSAT